MISNTNFNEFNFYLSGFVEEKRLLTELNDRISELKNEIGNITWNDLILIENSPTHNGSTIQIF